MTFGLLPLDLGLYVYVHVLSCCVVPVAACVVYCCFHEQHVELAVVPAQSIWTPARGVAVVKKFCVRFPLFCRVGAVGVVRPLFY